MRRGSGSDHLGSVVSSPTNNIASGLALTSASLISPWNKISPLCRNDLRCLILTSPGVSGVEHQTCRALTSAPGDGRTLPLYLSTLVAANPFIHARAAHGSREYETFSKSREPHWWSGALRLPGAASARLPANRGGPVRTPVNAASFPGSQRAAHEKRAGSLARGEDFT